MTLDSIEIRMDEYEELIECKHELEVYKKALELACTELSESQTESHYPFKWVCDSEDFKCDRRCEHKRGKFKGTLSYDDIDCWKSFFLQKAGEELG